MKKLLLFLFLFLHVVYADFEYKVNNTNITVAQESYMYNYNRLRLYGNYNEGGYFGTIIADGINYFGDNYIGSDEFNSLKLIHSDTAFKTQSSFENYANGSINAKIYRLYGGYGDAKNRVIIGLQNINMGVGHIWSPVNLFNPKNSFALESDEVFGVAALSYTRYLDATSSITVVAAQKEDETIKCGARYKLLTRFGDIALDVIASDNINMLGYEMESNLADTGVVLRSEIAYIKNSIKTQLGTDDIEYFQAIFGGEYGFENGLNITIEALYSSEKFLYKDILLNFKRDILSSMTYSNKYLGTMLSYSFNIFLDASLLYVESFNGKDSRFIAPAITYTLNDYNSFILGAQIQSKDNENEFGMSGDRYYVKWSLSF
ncbi:MAG: hypothetical protein A2513_10630 [Sulfurimonas sp. RIFOXYD12_FULL_33_39]|nr:MAG: hypothetical protein A3G74_02340 [Sulfurimonas sp. RIFCSPLOWO2_12_FULL_34_6]OHE09953.1 MAG: hypothetical protein A2513_10630 [Sulfurimonas sp. RIFOXYD12_FULL_33_39]OHE13926.1 MAG: hypothetical protein A2530_09125 [Sulfurimonas sp. RIFOXYD2_FULL_34_21]DAB28128.1 MAG TPA: hypothetical protein CFH78_04125 [Sulfurimonas sp. UBA10385]